MEIQTPEWRKVEDGAPQDLAVRDDDDQVRSGRAEEFDRRGWTQRRRLQDRNAQTLGRRLDRRRARHAFAPGRSVWLGYHRDNLEAALDQGDQRGHGKLRRTQEGKPRHVAAGAVAAAKR